MVRERLLERYPWLRKVPKDASEGLNSPLPPPPVLSWTDIMGHLLPVDGLDSDLDIEKGRDSQTTWHDVALSIGAEIVNDIRLSIHKDLGYTTSGGIARNKALAKLIASYKKPNSQVCIRKSNTSTGLLTRSR
jgi:DNA polymerase eta